MIFGDATLVETNQHLEVNASDGFAVARLRGLVTGDFDLRFSYALLTDMDSTDAGTGEPGVGLLFFAFDSFLIRTITSLPGGDRAAASDLRLARRSPRTAMA